MLSEKEGTSQLLMPLVGTSVAQPYFIILCITIDNP